MPEVSTSTRLQSFSPTLIWTSTVPWISTNISSALSPAAVADVVGVTVELAAALGDADELSAVLGVTLAVELSVALTDGVGVGLQTGQQSAWLVALPEQSQ